MSNKVAHCKICRAEVLWATSPAGRRIPIDAAPDPRGEYVIVRSDMYGYRGLARFNMVDHGYRFGRYTSHFKTCNYPGRKAA